jgi:AraC-like DNA-binding protein
VSLWGQDGEMWSGDGLTIMRRHSLRNGRTTWSEPFVVDGSGIVLPSTGGYRRRVQGVVQVVDRTAGLFHRCGEVAEVAHVSGYATTGTVINVDPTIHRQFVETEDWPSCTHLIDSRLDLSHRLLVRAIRAGSEPWLVEFRAVEIIDRSLAGRAIPCRGRSRRVDHRELIARIVELLRDAPTPLSFSGLARDVGYSTVHLTRAFRETTGVTMSEFRQRIRMSRVLDQLEAGADDLATVAIENGFSDHSHMTRAMAARLDLPPSRVRNLLRISSARPDTARRRKSSSGRDSHAD